MIFRTFFAAIFTSAIAASSVADSAAFPEPRIDLPTTDHALRTAVLAGGCFWGVELVFEHVKGVQSVTAGYAGGPKHMAYYSTVASGDTGHAEAVEITYDPREISYGQLLKLYFSVAHDPTELNRQGPDDGPQYRSTIFFASTEEEKVARAYIEQLQAAKVFEVPIVTTLEPLRGYYLAEAEHQDYATRFPNKPYVFLNDRPKLSRLRKYFPDLYR